MPFLQSYDCEMKFLGNKVRELREAREWTQIEMARRLWETGKFKGKTRQRVHQIESGEHASARTISALCEVFEVQPETFFDNEFWFLILRMWLHHLMLATRTFHSKIRFNITSTSFIYWKSQRACLENAHWIIKNHFSCDDNRIRTRNAHLMNEISRWNACEDDSKHKFWNFFHFRTQ